MYSYCRPQKQYVHLLAPPFHLIPISCESTIASKVVEFSWNVALKAVFLYANKLLDLNISYGMLFVHIKKYDQKLAECTHISTMPRV